METGANRVPPGNRDPRVTWARTGPLGSLGKRASQVCRALLDSPGQRVPLVPRGRTGVLGTLDREENWASKVRQAHLDQLVSWVLRERQEKRDLWARGAPQARLDLRVNKVFRAWKAERVSRETWGHPGPLGRKGRLDPGASPAPKEPLVTPDLLV